MGRAIASRARSAIAVPAARVAGLKTACHIQGGIDAGKKANGPSCGDPSPEVLGAVTKQFLHPSLPNLRG